MQHRLPRHGKSGKSGHAKRALLSRHPKPRPGPIRGARGASTISTTQGLCTRCSVTCRGMETSNSMSILVGEEHAFGVGLVAAAEARSLAVLSLFDPGSRPHTEVCYPQMPASMAAPRPVAPLAVLYKADSMTTTHTSTEENGNLPKPSKWLVSHRFAPRLWTNWGP